MFLDDLYDSLNRNEHRNAFCIKNEFYTYGYLKHKAALIQNELTGESKKQNSERIAIVCDDDILTYFALIGIWLLGCGYIPLGVHNPPERNLSILNDSGATTILTTHPLDTEIYQGYRIINLYDIVDQSVELQKKVVLEDQLAYILFTSGSTGSPKGVPISFGNLDSFLIAFEKSPIEIEAEDKCLQMFELTFDVSISSFLPALLKGACIYTIPNDVIKYLHVLKSIIKYGLTVIQIVPSVIRLSLPLLSKMAFPSVKHCILTGEATSTDLLSSWRKTIPSGSIFNFYGPTEATIYCSYYDCNESEINSYNGMIAIGKPLAGIKMIIVDDHGNEVKPGEKGELLISGSQLTSGYLNSESKNTTSFTSIGDDHNRNRFYRSGDVCYKNEKGTIHYCGRQDGQVKIQGFRIELSEIEICVKDISKINNVVITRKNKVDALELVLILESAETIDRISLLDKMKERLPEYMLPSSVFILKEFPLNSSGKTDRVQIKKLFNEQPSNNSRT
ncbi:MAG TPA: amino acid adenylation domain-containing protein [Candidatus Dojkabacteria bacterium]|nr:amino acid adenylation domain-containing protein [Candidatus Dojkabacteria bacterium]